MLNTFKMCGISNTILQCNIIFDMMVDNTYVRGGQTVDRG